MVKHLALDTNSAIALLNSHKETFDIIAGFDTICLPVTVCGELIFGAKNSRLNVKNEARYVAFIQSCALLDINLVVANTYAAIRLDLKKKGTPIPENDIWIAATCLSNNIPLLTYDKHFQNIRHLKVVK